ncbi:MAG: hypothetical protein ACE5Q6_17405 [Dehalococcoidia bacterium]
MRVPIVELTGPSGSGKSTVYRHLAAESDCQLAPIVRFLPGMVLKSRIYWLLAPLVLVLFRRLFLAIWQDRKREALGPMARILGNLSWVLARQSIAYGQARLTGKTVMVDEGFLQAGLGFSYQLGDSFTGHWKTYANSIPRSIWYAVFQCRSEVAALRSMARPSGPPHNMRNYLSSLDSDTEKALARTNQQYQRLLQQALRSAELTWLPVDGELPVADCADQLVHAVEPR